MVGRLLLFLAFTTTCGAAAASSIDECVFYSPTLVGHCALLHGGYKDPSFSTDQKTTVASLTPAEGSDVKRAETAPAYNRGVERLNAGATKLAIADFTDVIRLKEDDALAFA